MTIHDVAFPSDIPPDICILFERIANDMVRLGFNKYSADAILHRVRWHMHVERGNRGFKANNNWTPTLARWFMARNPAAKSFFELRVAA